MTWLQPATRAPSYSSHQMPPHLSAAACPPLVTGLAAELEHAGDPRGFSSVSLLGALLGKLRATSKAPQRAPLCRSCTTTPFTHSAGPPAT